MSADNGIYIAGFEDGFRVVHAQAIENLNYYPEHSDLWYAEFISYFGNAHPYKTYNAALDKAQSLYHEIMHDNYCGIIEYGIQFLGSFEFNMALKKKELQNHDLQSRTARAQRRTPADRSKDAVAEQEIMATNGTVS